MAVGERLRRVPRDRLLDGFVIANLAFLSVDVFIAHSVNAFREPVERVPVGFGVIAAAVLVGALALDAFDPIRPRARLAGRWVGGASLVVGVAGLLYHLFSSFFAHQTLRSLVYTAPFAAPLAFAGLGFLLLMNRSVPRESLAWGQWVMFFAWGGFVGNLALSLADHAQNGFFDAREWIPVFAAAIAVGFLLFATLRPGDAQLLRATYAVLVLEIVVGLAGFVFHVRADARHVETGVFQAVLYGAPPFAPLLFADLAMLAALGVWDVESKRGGAAV